MKYLMNPDTGSVDTEEAWRAEMAAWDGEETEEERQAQLARLVEVQQDDNGDWVEVD